MSYGQNGSILKSEEIVVSCLWMKLPPGQSFQHSPYANRVSGRELAALGRQLSFRCLP